MSRNRTGMVLVDKWRCDNCYCVNDEDWEECWNCGADTDGMLPETEGENDDFTTAD